MKEIMLIAFVTVFCFSCQKNNNATPQPDKIEIMISSPYEGQVFHKGDTMSINASGTYISMLHGYELKVTDKNTGKELFYKYEHVNKDNFTINTLWPDTLSNKADLLISLLVQIDHDGNERKKEINCTSQP